MTSPNEYGDKVSLVAGCTCHPKRVVQMLDDKGNFVIEHYHDAGCAKTANAKRWHDRIIGIGVPDHRSNSDRASQRDAFLAGEHLL